MPSSIFWGMQHLNSNVLCGLKTELTGPDPLMHELIEVALVPLDHKLELHGTFPLFNMRMRPQVTDPSDNFRSCRLSRSEIADACLRAFDRDKVADLLLYWFQSMDLPPKKRIIPLTWNFPMERQILINWLGYETYAEIFSEDHRDLMVAAHFLNDRLCCKGEPVMFAKQNLTWLARICNVEQLEKGTATSDAFLMAETYKRMLQV
jgi:hypothetical protein